MKKTSEKLVPITRLGMFFGGEDYDLDVGMGQEWLEVYQKTLDDLGVEIWMGDYIGYYESEDRVRYYVVSDDGYVKSDNKHTYGGYKPFYRTITATWVSENEFRGI